MKFYFKKLKIWCKNGTSREIDFLPNKVNVITGGSSTGKSSILQIIDYCFFATSHKISEDIINENVEWYGINFFINGRVYTIARKSPDLKKVSDKYYFSSIGEIPETLFITDYNADQIKKTMENEFSINSNVIIKGGSNELKKDSKISIRYFMLFNTISYSIIDNEDVFFDKQHKERYRIALERIFDLSLGIENVENILKREEENKLKLELEQKQRKEKIALSKKEDFYEEKINIIKNAKEYGLIEDDNIDTAIIALKEIIKNKITSIKERNTNRAEEILKEIYLLKKKIDNIRSFTEEYNLYKKSLNSTVDSLKPISYLMEYSHEIVKTSIYSQILTSLETDFTNIKIAIRSKTPISRDIDGLVKEYKEKIVSLEEELRDLPEEIKSFDDDIDKYIFIGEAKAKFELFESKSKSLPNKYIKDIEEIETKLLNLDVLDISEQRKLTITLLEEKAQEYLSVIKKALTNYSEHKVVFNYKEKRLELRRPDTDHTINTGSSSVDMFLHLLMFLGFHKVVLSKKVPYIAPFLIMDQPSKPYYGEENKDNYQRIEETDKFKINNVFKLLNSFIEGSSKENDFQIILFEHVPKETWKEYPNVHLVEEFRNGNALLRKENLRN
ncbi:DUF3732 domain-containing protein [Aliarcobacter butzleri]